MNIRDLVHEAYKTAREKGWHDEPASFGDRIALCHSELSEALEAYRDFAELSTGEIGPNGKPVGVPSELADVIIRIADMCGLYGIDLEAAITEKMAFNMTRPYRHGGKRL
jgi:NTP pyrophosphatase (non-canonical NTP hydrolase)